MRRRLLCLPLLLLAACVEPYRVYVTGYTGGPPTSIPDSARVAVVENPAARNPLLEQEVVAKVRRALAQEGFRPVAPAEADVAVMLEYGAGTRIEHGEELKYEPGQTTELKDSTGKVIGTATTGGSFSHQPVSSTVDVLWLTMTAVDARLFRESRPGKPLWIGESKSTGANLDLRSGIDVLLLPTAWAFGRDQRQTRSEFRPDDARVAALRTPDAAP